MLWLLPFVLADAPASDRWVEHDTRLRRDWIAGQDAFARSWPDDDGRVEAVAAWMAGWRSTREHEPYLADHLDGVTLWIASTFVEDRDDPRRSEWSQEVRVQRDGEEPVAIEVGDPERPPCTSRLLPGRAVIGRTRPLEPDDPLDKPRVCELFAVDLDTLEVTPFGEGPWANVVAAPDGRTWTLSGKKRTLVEARDADGTLLDSFHWRRRRTLTPTPDGLWVASRGSKVWVGEDPSDLERRFDTTWWGQHLHVDEDSVWMRTGRRANGGEVVELEVDAQDPRDWRARVAERPGSDLQGAWMHLDRVFTAWSRDGSVHLEVQPRDGGPSTHVPLGGPWTSLSMFRTWSQRGAVLRAYSPLGRTTWRLDVVDDELVWTELDSTMRDDVVMETLQLPTDDGVVPVTLLRRADAQPDGESPLWAYVYGGFGRSQAAHLDPARELFLAAGGTVAVVHAHGGRERGEAWHLDAIEENLGRTIDDVTAAVRGLVDAGWAAPGRVGLEGASNGGLTVTAALADAPELYGAVIAGAGVFDLIDGPGWPGFWWPDEYGRPRGEQRPVLEALSPRHNPPTRLPPTLVITGEHDPVVPPRHSYTLAAAWDTLPGGPLLLRVDGHGTHGGRKRDRDDRVRSEFRAADAHRVAFLLKALDMDVPPLP